VRKESPNGEAKRQLASSERVAMLTSTERRKWRRGKNLHPLPPFIGGEEREGASRSHTSVTVCRHRANFPLLCATDGWGHSRYFNVARARCSIGLQCSEPNPLKLLFIISKLNQNCKLQKPPYVVPKIPIIFMLIE
jgi:hypothetical protein